MKPIILAAATAGLMSATPALANGDWTGFYAGIGIGNLDVDTNTGLSNDDVSYGFHGGYRYDFGQWVTGGEIEYEIAEVSLAPGVDVDSVARLKGILGYDLGQTLLYGTAGVAEVDVSNLGRETGGFYGVGVAYAVTPTAVLSLEVLDHDFNNINSSGVDADATSINLRASLRF